jgi:hypothetical protein
MIASSSSAVRVIRAVGFSYGHGTGPADPSEALVEGELARREEPDLCAPLDLALDANDDCGAVTVPARVGTSRDVLKVASPEGATPDLHEDPVDARVRDQLARFVPDQRVRTRIDVGPVLLPPQALAVGFLEPTEQFAELGR